MDCEYWFGRQKQMMIEDLESLFGCKGVMIHETVALSANKSWALMKKGTKGKKCKYIYLVQD